MLSRSWTHLQAILAEYFDADGQDSGAVSYCFLAANNLTGQVSNIGMKLKVNTLAGGILFTCGILFLAGCSSVSTYTRAYMTAPTYPASNPANIKILAAEPKQPFERLGEIFIGTEGEPSREQIEKKLRAAAAQLGADAVYITADKLNITPVVYLDWWGPTTTGQDVRRNLVAVAVKFR